MVSLRRGCAEGKASASWLPVPATRRLQHALLLVLASMAVPPANAEPEPVSFEQSPYRWVVAEVEQGPPSLRRTFAEVALEALAEDCEREILASEASGRGAPSDARAAAKLQSWRRGAEAYLEQVLAARAAVAGASEVFVLAGRSHEVRVVADETQIMLGAFRLTDQSALEALIAERMCRYVACGQQPETIAEVITAEERGVRHAWSFSDGAASAMVASDGLSCQYEDRLHLRLKGRVCRALLKEVRLIDAAVTRLEAMGQTVDDDALALSGPPDTPRLVFNRAGASAIVPLTVLVQTPALLPDAFAWVAARRRGDPVAVAFNLPNEVIYVTGSDLEP